ncbi:signal recognition particle-docking protein FtsY [Oculatella sp. LEGE 06141]|uniref:signal recognition particle-docking protein FtsY n=1 Tax=Oculatella sp. LEGE 06141 TaxID=1828648 RepID=UPI001881466F|nr:signal recognition particle-docking protein FtsY [Oculatella sp. LEGE 06141]MBE9178400.1 signal recognition particle-docking protein FtsY [Oculatella sp. LEGE 06141]
MSPFNWFNRKHNEPAKEPEVDSNQEPQVEPDVTPAESTEPAEQPPAIAEDYLTWAKAAYQNIQKRQQQEVVAPEAEAPEAPATDSPVEAAVEAAVEVGETLTEPEPTPVAAISPVEAAHAAVEAPVESDEAIAPPAIEEPLPEPEVSEPEDLSEPVTVDETATEAEAVPELTEPAEAVPEPDVAPVAAIEETLEAAEPAAPLPFWARAEAERQERLERIRAEAIEAVEPEVVRPATAELETAPDLTGIEFDENFLWSAEVLAAQGRRPEDVSVEEITWLKRLRQGLDKTRRNLVNQLRSIVGQGPLNQDAVTEIESLLLQADVGIAATDFIIESLQAKLRQEALPPSEAIAYLKQILRGMLDKPLETYSPTFTPEKDTLNIWLMTGVNGAGKTTTIGKIAHIAKKSDYTCLIAAADTFRAAAVEQVKIWGQRSNIEVIANPGKNTDPAAVVFDAIAAAQSRGTQLLLVDTAGRLQNKKNLMDELSKIRRIIDKKAPDAKVESLLVLDATLGQNGLRQAEVFSEAAQLSGVVLTKLDGTAKGGIALAVVQQLGLPIRFIGAGEGIEDLRPFSSYEFVEALLNG